MMQPTMKSITRIFCKLWKIQETQFQTKEIATKLDLHGISACSELKSRKQLFIAIHFFECKQWFAFILYHFMQQYINFKCGLCLKKVYCTFSLICYFMQLMLQYLKKWHRYQFVLHYAVLICGKCDWTCMICELFIKLYSNILTVWLC